MPEAAEQPSLMHVGDPFAEPVAASRLAEVLGVDIRSIQNWDARGWIKRRERGLYVLGEAIRGIYEGQRDLINRKKPEVPEGQESADDADRRKKVAAADLAELELRQKRGELLPAGDVRRQAFKRARELRDAIEVIPSVVSPILAAESDPHKVREVLAIAIHGALKGLTDMEDEKPEEEKPEEVKNEDEKA